MVGRVGGGLLWIGSVRALIFYVDGPTHVHFARSSMSPAPPLVKVVREGSLMTRPSIGDFDCLSPFLQCQPNAHTCNAPNALGLYSTHTQHAHVRICHARHTCIDLI